MTTEPDPALHITYDGKEATTAALAAAELGWTTRRMHITLARLGITPLPRADSPDDRAEIDGRTPLYDAGEIRRAVDSRPGRGRRG